jgi:hypothetical protein
MSAEAKNSETVRRRRNKRRRFVAPKPDATGAPNQFVNPDC